MLLLKMENLMYSSGFRVYQGFSLHSGYYDDIWKMMTTLITNIIIQFGLEGVFQEIITCITDMVINFIEEINIWIYVK